MSKSERVGPESDHSGEEPAFGTVTDFTVDFTGIGISTEEGDTDPGRAYRNSVLQR